MLVIIHFVTKWLLIISRFLAESTSLAVACLCGTELWYMIWRPFAVTIELSASTKTVHRMVCLQPKGELALTSNEHPEALNLRASAEATMILLCRFQIPNSSNIPTQPQGEHHVKVTLMLCRYTFSSQLMNLSCSPRKLIFRFLNSCQ